MRRSSLALLAAALFASACSGPGATTDGPDGPGPDAPTYPAYETFDPSGYEAAPAPADVTIVHDVPPAVMEGRVVVPGADGANPDPDPEPDPTPDPPASQQVEGFRVQVYASENRQNAERVRSDALRWWRSLGRGETEAIVAYIQPYYRVRLGAFASRAEADAALEIVRREYPEAFLAPDVITVER